MLFKSKNVLLYFFMIPNTSNISRPTWNISFQRGNGHEEWVVIRTSYQNFFLFVENVTLLKFKRLTIGVWYDEFTKNTKTWNERNSFIYLVLLKTVNFKKFKRFYSLLSLSSYQIYSNCSQLGKLARILHITPVQQLQIGETWIRKITLSTFFII